MLWRLVFDVKYASLCFCRLQHNFSFEAMEKEEPLAPQKSSTALNSATELFVATTLSLSPHSSSTLHDAVCFGQSLSRQECRHFGWKAALQHKELVS